jgi:two-component system, OmpR family, sensor histidine kinase KdpD
VPAYGGDYNLAVYSRRMVEAGRWLLIANILAGVVAVYKFGLQANQTTVSLTFLVVVLVLAGTWGLRYSVGASLAATVLFNYFFLPPVGTLTIGDTQNWIALFAFLASAMYASHLAARIREQSNEANTRRREAEMLYRLARQLLQPENVAELLNSIPLSVASAFNSPAVTLYMADGDRIYLSDAMRISTPRVRWRPEGETNATERPRAEIVRELRAAMQMPVYRVPDDGYPTAIPLRTVGRPIGALLLECVGISRETMEAVAGVVALSIERAQALENSARSEAAKETERLRTALLDSVTHELRTPLTAIKASVSALMSQDALNAESREELLTVIDEESDRLNRLIEEAVDMAQLDANKVQLDVRAHAVLMLVQAAVEHARSLAPKCDFRVSVAANVGQVLADAAWIQKVLGNLLGNAMKYSGGAEPISVSAEQQGEMVSISVADRGAGIDPLEQGMIFEKFYRGRQFRDPSTHNRVSGTGMGLAISKAIVEAHGGAITVASQPGQGAAFTFTLPAAADERVVDPAGQVTAARTGGSAV